MVFLNKDTEGIGYYSSGTPNYEINFENDFENGLFFSYFSFLPLSFFLLFLLSLLFFFFLDCTYDLGVMVTFSTGSSISTTRNALIFSAGNG